MTVSMLGVVLATILIGAACSSGGEDAGTPASDADIPTQVIQYGYLPGTESLEWTRDNADLILTAKLIEIRPEELSRYEPESMDDIESVFKGLVFEPIEVYKGEAPSGDVVVLDDNYDRNRLTKKKVWYLLSDAYPMTEADIGRTFALFLARLPASWEAPGAYGFANGRYGAVLVRANGKIEVHRPDDKSNPWLAYQNADLDAILADLGLVGS